MIPTDLDFAAAAAVQPAAPLKTRDDATAEAIGLATADHRSRYVIRNNGIGDYHAQPTGGLALEDCATHNATIVATVHYGRPRAIQSIYQRGEAIFTHPEQTRAELDAHNAMIRASYAAEGARNALLRSEGHRAIIGQYEYFVAESHGTDLCLYKAPARNAIDIRGYRLGARYVCGPGMIDHTIDADRACHEAAELADRTGAPVTVWRTPRDRVSHFTTGDQPDGGICYTTIGPATIAPPDYRP